MMKGRRVIALCKGLLLRSAVFALCFLVFGFLWAIVALLISTKVTDLSNVQTLPALVSVLTLFSSLLGTVFILRCLHVVGLSDILRTRAE
jgi:hypothetical protein